MLAPQQVKPFLCHEEKIVREHAAEYFAKSFSRDPELMPLVLESCARYGEEESSLLLAYARHFVQSDISIRAVLGRLPRVADVNVMFHYNAIISHADVGLLKPVMSRIRNTRNILAETVAKIERRLLLVPYTTEQLWEELFAYCAEIAPRRFDEVDFAHGLHLVEALARKGDLPVGELKRCLQDEEKYCRYDELYLVILAGEAGLAETIPELLGKLRIDADLLCQYAGESLVKIGTKEVIAQLKGCFPEESWHFRNFAASIFGDIKIPASEDALLEIFPGEEDPGIKTFLAMDFCSLISEKGVPLVKRLLEENCYDRAIVDLREPLYASCRILGLELEEMQVWKKELEQEELNRKQRLKSMDALWSPSSRPLSPKKFAGRKKVGRNQPCPCGSGRKYKKCCGKS